MINFKASDEFQYLLSEFCKDNQYLQENISRLMKNALDFYGYAYQFGHSYEESKQIPVWKNAYPEVIKHLQSIGENKLADDLLYIERYHLYDNGFDHLSTQQSKIEQIVINNIFAPGLVFHRILKNDTQPKDMITESAWKKKYRKQIKKAFRELCTQIRKHPIED